MKKLFFASLFTVASVFSYSQSTEKIDNIKKLLEITGAAKMGKVMLNTMINAYQSSNIPLDTTLLNEIQSENNINTLMDMIIPVYDKYYTDAEIKELITFYSTPIGKKLIETMPAVVQESMLIGQKWGEKVEEKIRKKRLGR